MKPHLASPARCAKIAGLRPQEIILGVSPQDKHKRLLAKYLFLSPVVARTRLAAEIRDALEMQDSVRAADFLLVLRLLLSMQPVVALAPPRRDGVRSTLARSRTPLNVEERGVVSARRDGNVVRLFDGRPRSRELWPKVGDGVNR